MPSDAAIQADLTRRASHREMLLKPPYTTACPRCHAAVNKPCRRADGELRPAHVQRIDAVRANA